MVPWIDTILRNPLLVVNWNSLHDLASTTQEHTLEGTSHISSSLRLSYRNFVQDTARAVSVFPAHIWAGNWSGNATDTRLFDHSPHPEGRGLRQRGWADRSVWPFQRSQYHLTLKPPRLWSPHVVSLCTSARMSHSTMWVGCCLLTYSTKFGYQNIIQIISLSWIKYLTAEISTSANLSLCLLKQALGLDEDRILSRVLGEVFSSDRKNADNDVNGKLSDDEFK